jgi:U4/U6 small nuclear ribonucleoprotein PRP4
MAKGIGRMSLTAGGSYSLFKSCSSWTGVAKLWSVPDVKQVGIFKGQHMERVTDVAFHPESCQSLEPSAGNLATASADCKAMLWSLDGKHLQSYEGHLDRLARLAFHPSGAYLGTASYDKTWRLWDVSTGCRGEERIETSRDIDLLEQRINSEHTT